MNGIESPAAIQQDVAHVGAGEAICLGGKTEKCLFVLVGMTVSPVNATLQLSAFEQMGTNLHLINPLPAPLGELSFSSSPSPFTASCRVTD